MVYFAAAPAGGQGLGLGLLPLCAPAHRWGHTKSAALMLPLRILLLWHPKALAPGCASQFLEVLIQHHWIMSFLPVHAGICGQTEASGQTHTPRLDPQFQPTFLAVFQAESTQICSQLKRKHFCVSHCACVKPKLVPATCPFGYIVGYVSYSNTNPHSSPQVPCEGTDT